MKKVKKRKSLTAVIALAVLAILIIFYYAGLFSFIANLFHKPALTPDVACGNGLCEYDYKDVSTCAQDCKQLRTLKSSEIEESGVGANIGQHFSFISWTPAVSNSGYSWLFNENQKAVFMEESTNAMNYAEEAGIKNIKIVLSWSAHEWPNSIFNVKPTQFNFEQQRTFNWNYSDALISGLTQRGINVSVELKQLNQNPFGECYIQTTNSLIRDTRGGIEVVEDETYMDAWLRFVNESVKRYKNNVSEWKLPFEFYVHPLCYNFRYLDGRNISARINDNLEVYDYLIPANTKIGTALSDPRSDNDENWVEVRDVNGVKVGNIQRVTGMHISKYTFLSKETSKVIKQEDKNAKVSLGLIGSWSIVSHKYLFNPSQGNIHGSINSIIFENNMPHSNFDEGLPEYPAPIANKISNENIARISGYENQLNFYKNLINDESIQINSDVWFALHSNYGGADIDQNTRAKYLSRHYIMAFGLGQKKVYWDGLTAPTGSSLGNSYFIIVGTLPNDENPTWFSPAYYSLQKIGAIFNNGMKNDSSVEISFSDYSDNANMSALKKFAFNKNDKTLFAYWLAIHPMINPVSADSFTDITIDKILEHPVLVDMFTGEVWNLRDGTDYTISNGQMTFINMPLHDYPMLIAEKSAIPLQLSARTDLNTLFDLSHYEIF